MSYYATPRDEWPTRAEANAEPDLTPASPELTDALTRLLAAIQESIRHQ